MMLTMTTKKRRIAIVIGRNVRSYAIFVFTLIFSAASFFSFSIVLLPRERTTRTPRKLVAPLMQGEISSNHDNKTSTRTVHSTTINGFNVPSTQLGKQPQWIQNYFRWHREMRAHFPGAELFNNPNAPKILIRTCSVVQRCGGLHDRLGKLPWDLYLANQTRRILLINWCKPTPLEEFLVPNQINWSIPTGVERYFESAPNCTGTVNRITDLFKDFNSFRPGIEFWEEDLDKAIERAAIGEFADVKVLKSVILGDDSHLQERLAKEGETDMLGWSSSGTFGQLFWLFFKPSVGLQKELDNVYNQLQLSPNHYVATHCRVRHPKARRQGRLMEGKSPGWGGPDRVGLLWKGESRRFAIETAIRALQCADIALKQNHNEPVYFYADSEDLVRFVSQQQPTDTASLSRNNSINETDNVDAAELAVIRNHRILARQIHTETLHIDRQLDHPPADYYASFVDLFIAAQARCVAAGVGNFALFAAKLSDNPCLVQYQSEAWGDEGVKNAVSKQQCHLANRPWL